MLALLARAAVAGISTYQVVHGVQQIQDGNYYQGAFSITLGVFGLYAATKIKLGACFVAGTQVFDGEVEFASPTVAETGEANSRLTSLAGCALLAGAFGYVVLKGRSPRETRAARAPGGRRRSFRLNGGFAVDDALAVDEALRAGGASAVGGALAYHRRGEGGKYESGEYKNAFAGPVAVYTMTRHEFENLAQDRRAGEARPALAAALLSPDDGDPVSADVENDVEHTTHPVMRNRRFHHRRAFADAWLAGFLLLAVALALFAWPTRAPAPGGVGEVEEFDHDQPAPFAVNLQGRNIEDLRPGDYVLAKQPSTGRIARKRVLHTFTRVANHLRVLTIRGADGEVQTLQTTDEHPFFLSDGNQRDAGALAPGDELQHPDGAIAQVISTHRDPRPEGVTVYNLEVEDYHTYYVGTQERGFSLWAHNANCLATPRAARHGAADHHNAMNAEAALYQAGMRHPAMPLGVRPQYLARTGGALSAEVRTNQAPLNPANVNGPPLRAGLPTTGGKYNVRPDVQVLGTDGRVYVTEITRRLPNGRVDTNYHRVRELQLATEYGSAWGGYFHIDIP